MTYKFRGGRDKAASFIDWLQLISLETHVADIRSAILHPASSTHHQLNEEQLKSAGIEPGLVRLSVGLENVKDIKKDLEQALESLNKS